MSETLQHHTPNRIQVETPTTEQLDIIVNGAPSTAEAEFTPDHRETSRAANTLGRIANFLEQRAINKAHKNALKEYRAVDNFGYTDHISNLAESGDASQQFTGQTLLDKEHRRADRQKFVDNTIESAVDTIEAAKNMARTTGETALKIAQASGDIALGISFLTVEATAKGAVNTYRAGANLAETGALKAMYASEKIKDTAIDLIETGRLKGMYAAEATKEGLYDAKEAIRTKLDDLSNAAKQRRQARRDRWSARKDTFLGFVDSAKETGKDTIDATAEKGRRALSPLRAGRAAVQAALSAGRTTYSTHIDQDKL